MNNEMKKRIAKINELLKEDGITAVNETMFKNNQKREGVILQGKDYNSCPVVYFSDKIWKKTDQEVVGYLKRYYKEYAKNIDVSSVTSREYVLQHVLPKVYSWHSKPDLKEKGIAFVPLLDMVVVFYVPIEDFVMKGELASYNVTEELLKETDIDLDELYQMADRNAEKECEIFSMQEIMQQMIRQGVISAQEGKPVKQVMLVVSNRSNVNGAGMIASRGALEKIAEILGSRFVILPSSIHELICVPYLMEAEEYISLVRHVNLTYVKPEEKLTDSAYIWDDGELCQYIQ